MSSLAPAPPKTCPRCNGSGWIPLDNDSLRVEPCGCQGDLRRRQRITAASIPRRYYHCRIGNFHDRGTGSLIAAKRKVQEFVDVWPLLPVRATAPLDLVGRIATLIFACVFIWYGIEFTRFAWGRLSELAELPLWLIHVAWPLAGITWIVFGGEHALRDLRLMMRGRV